MTTFNHINSHQDSTLPSHQQTNLNHDGDNAGNNPLDIGAEDRSSRVEDPDVICVNEKVDIAHPSAEVPEVGLGLESGLPSQELEGGSETDVEQDALPPAADITEITPIPQTKEYLVIDVWMIIGKILKSSGHSKTLNNIRLLSWSYNLQLTELFWRFIVINQSTLECFLERLVRGKRLRQAGFTNSFRRAEANLIQGLSLIKDITFDSITTGPSSAIVRQLDELHHFQQILNAIYSADWIRESAQGITSLLIGRLANITFVNCSYKAIIAISRILRNLCRPVGICIKSRDGDIDRIHLGNIAGILFQDSEGTPDETEEETVVKTINVHQAHANFNLGIYYSSRIKSRISLDLIKGCGCSCYIHQDPEAEERCLRKRLTDSLCRVYASIYIGGKAKFQNTSADGLLEILEPIPRLTSNGYSLLIEVANKALPIIAEAFLPTETLHQTEEVDERWSSQESFIERCQQLVIFKFGHEIDWSKESNCQSCRSSLNIAIRPVTAAESGISPIIQQDVVTESQGASIDDSLLC